ncbi:MAG TPA: hypothetical protein VGS20_03115 [Candidatus Acidoferrales bacterium]|nr:hypothetical protein [Candidatus Acidoferrales bacterium]
MANLGPMLHQLKEERKRTKRELDRLDGAIAAIGKLAGNHSRPARGGRPRVRRRLSAAARKRIADAQRARWAKIRKQRAAA